MKKEIAEFIELFLSYIVDIRGYSKATAITYQDGLYQMIESSHLYQEGEVWVFDITPYRFKIAQKSRRTIHTRLTAIHAFAHYLENQHHKNIRLLNATWIKVPKGLPKPIDQHYINEVIENSTPQERLLLAMLYGLGLRISELSSLRLDQIQKEWVTVHGKGDKTRQIPLLEIIHHQIEIYRQNHTPQHYLFEKNALPLNTAQLRYRLIKLFKTHGIKATPHQLRHSFATHLLQEGARIADVSELLGHSTMATTQIYTKLGSTQKMEAYMNAHPLAKKHS